MTSAMDALKAAPAEAKEDTVSEKYADNDLFWATAVRFKFAASWLKFVVEDEESKVDSKTAEKKLEVQLEKVCKNEVILEHLPPSVAIPF